MMAPTAGAADSYASPSFDTLIGSSKQHVFLVSLMYLKTSASGTREGERPSKTKGKIYEKLLINNRRINFSPDANDLLQKKSQRSEMQAYHLKMR